MADEDKKTSVGKRVTADQRMKFIGFEVFPGKTKDLFKTEAEKEKYVDGVLARRTEGKIIRDDCKLLEERVSAKERIVLTIASVVVVLALFLPWYSAYTEIIEESSPTQSELTADTTLMPDSVLLSSTEGDTTAMLAPVETEVAGDEQADSLETPSLSSEPVEEIITHHRVKQKVNREYQKLSGIGSFIALGTVGSHIFSSGAIVILTAIIFLLNSLLCLALPALTLYCLYGLRGDEVKITFKLKKYLRLNWLPVILFTIAFVMSFFGADYGPGTVGAFTSIGNSYGPGVFLGTLSWGVFVSMAALILVAVKGIEI